MRRSLLLLACAAVLLGVQGCRRKRSPESEPAATREAEPFARVRRERAKYDQLKAGRPDQYVALRHNAGNMLNYARAEGDTESMEYFQGEVGRLHRQYRELGEGIVQKAELAAQRAEGPGAAPDEVWEERWTIWKECVQELNTTCRENRDMIEMAQNRVAEARNLHEAYMRFLGRSMQAEHALISQEDPEAAVAHLAYLRAWLRANGVVGESAGNGEGAQDGAAPGIALLALVDAKVAEYEKKCTVTGIEGDKGGAEGAGPDLSGVPFRDVEFLADFNWHSDGGECEASGGQVNVHGGGMGGVIESAASDWFQFVFLMEVRIVEGTRLFVGARPTVSLGSGESEYRERVRVSLGAGEWHSLRVQVLGNDMRVIRVDGDAMEVVGGPAALRPVGGPTVRGSFMIGVEAGTRIEIRGMRIQVASTGEDPEAGAGEEPAGDAPGFDEEPDEDDEDDPWS